MGSYGIARAAGTEVRGYLGVSIGARFFSRRNLAALMGWASERFKSFLLLVADDPHAYTFMATKGLAYDAALKKARALGSEKGAMLDRCIRSIGVRNVVAKRWKELDADPVYASTLACARSCYREDLGFRRDVLCQVSLRNRLLPEPTPPASVIAEGQADIAAEYVLAEIAAMVYLQERSSPSWPIQVFPLPMPLPLRGLYEERYCGELAQHTDRSGYVQISIE